VQHLIELLNGIPLAGLMLVVALGFTVGRLAWRGMSIGPSGGTLVIALLLGYAGLDFQALYGGVEPALTVGAFGFALFIYSVGFEAGPRFFSSLMGGPGWRFVVIGTTVNVLAIVCVIVGGKLLGLNASITAGVLSGAMTSAPTYAAAAEVCDDPTGLAVSFAFAFPIGLVGLVLLIQFVPKLMGDDLSAELDDTEDRDGRGRGRSLEFTRAFDVQKEEVIGRTLRDLDLTHRTGTYITMVHRGSEIFAASADTELREGDHLLVRGRLEELHGFEHEVGPEVLDQDLHNRMPAPRRIIVVSPDVIGKTLSELNWAHKYRCLIVGIGRGGVDVEPSSESHVERGDVLRVVGRRGDVRALATAVGRYERPTNETDIAIYAGGIFLGLLFGRVSLELGGIDFALGTAGGLLLAGILLGRFRTIGPIRTNVPQAARQLVRDLGILLFIAETGVKAGGSSLDELHGLLGPTLGVAAAATVISVVGAIWIARRVLKMRAVDAWGSVGGGMTSSAALVAVRRAAESNEPALSYAAAYAVASVLVTLAGRIVILVMQ